MKKIWAVILSMVYLFSSVGPTIHLHYCMDKLVAWGILDKGNKDCTFCGMPKQSSDDGCAVSMKGCCRDEHKQIRNHEDQRPGQSSVGLNKIAPAVVVLSYNAWEPPFVCSLVAARPLANGPPLAGGVPVFLRNCNFRI